MKNKRKFNIEGFQVLNTGEINVPFSFHDAIILNENLSENNGAKLILTLDNEGSFTSFNKIIFNDYIIKHNTEIKGVWCLDSRFFIKENGRYETTLEIQAINKNTNHTNIWKNSTLVINSKSIEFFGVDSLNNNVYECFLDQY
ncbi:MAG: hypothetical protein IJR70_09640 [Eubacterium sp.]|nr:hypothetical protein [Eubacterium sp.]